MSLLTRLVAPLEGEIKLPVHQFMAEMAELQRGEIVKQKIVDDFLLTAAEELNLDAFIAEMGVSFDRNEFHDVMMMGERGLYTPAEVQFRLIGT
jgi:hypothetical protein